MIHSFRKTTSMFGLVLAVSALLSGSPQEASAQGISLGDALGNALSEAFSKGFEAAKKRRIAVTPLVNTINDSTREITLEFEHKSDAKLTAKLTIGNDPSGGVAGKDSPVATDSVIKNKPLLLDEEENKKDTSSISYKPMAGWIAGLPESITIAPGEKKKITVKVKIPAGAVAGEYAAWIAAYVDADETASVKMPTVGITKLVYKK